MSIFRSLVSLNKKNYVKDGLILWCDGIKNSSSGHATGTPTTWKNLVGNVDLSFYGTTLWQITNNAMRLEIAQGGSFKNDNIRVTTSSNLTSSNAWTIEQYLTLTSGGGNNRDASAQIVVLQNSDAMPGNNIKYCNFLRYNEAVQFAGYAGDFYASSSLTGQKVLLTTIYTGTKFQIYINGILMTENTRTYSNNYTRYLVIGPARNGTGAAGSAYKKYDVSFHSIRYYTKALSAEEVANNYQVDLKRFS